MGGDAGAGESVLLLVGLWPSCLSVAAGLGMAITASALVLAGYLLKRLVRALHARLGRPDSYESRGPHLPGQTVQDVAARLRHDSPGGWTAGETRWTLAHEHAWFSSPEYRTFLLVVLGATLSWAFGITFAHRLCG